MHRHNSAFTTNTAAITATSHDAMESDKFYEIFWQCPAPRVLHLRVWFITVRHVGALTGLHTLSSCYSLGSIVLLLSVSFFLIPLNLTTSLLFFLKLLIYLFWRYRENLFMELLGSTFDVLAAASSEVASSAPKAPSMLYHPSPACRPATVIGASGITAGKPSITSAQ